MLKALENYTGLVIFNKKQLVHQTYEFLIKNGFDVGIAFGEGVDLRPITLCTIQSIDKVLDTHLKHSEFIIIDEVHEFSKGKLSLKVIKSFPKASYRIGMTATVPKDPVAKLNLISALGRVIKEVDASELIDLGFLTKPKIHILPAPEVLLKPKDSYIDVYRKAITENDLRNSLIYRTIKTVQENPSKTLILPEITHLVNARGLKSEIATLQALGRALRTHSSKQEVYIYDFMDKAPYLEKHSKERIKSYKSLNFEVINNAKEKRKIQD